MSRLSVLVHPSKPADERPARRWLSVSWLVVFCYLLAAYLVTFRLWAHPSALVPTYGHGIQSDVLLNLWFMRDIATALAHGHLPALVTTSLNSPQGVNLMWNTSLLLPGVILTPVTLFSGPAVSLAVLLTLGFAGSAISMFAVLRYWGASVSAAFIGGAFFGFSPALRMAAVDHYHLQFAVLPPLIIHFLLRLVTGRGRPVRSGAWLGLLVAAQMFIAEEVLVDTVLAALIILAVLAISRLSEIRGRIKPVAAGLGVALGVALVLCGRAMWVQFIGPLSESGSPWHVSKFGNSVTNLTSAPVGMLIHGPGAVSGEPSVEYFAYLGWPLLIVLLAASVYFWRDIRVRVGAVTFVVLGILSIGGHETRIGWLHITAVALPWHWLGHLPLLSQALPNRLFILADGGAAVVLAVTIDKIRAALPANRRALGPAILVAAWLVLVPVIPQPLSVASLGRPPAGWADVVKGLHLKAGASLLVLPLGPEPRGMEWQALTGERISVVGGFCIAPAPESNAGRTPEGLAAQCDAVGTLTTDQQTTQLRMTKLAAGQQGVQPATKTMALALAAWRPAAVITTVGGKNPLGRYLLHFFGRPTAHHGAVLGWRINRQALQSLALRYGGKPFAS